MGRSYSAFGLAVRSAFPLPGMRQVEVRGLPSLSLDLETPAELDLAWSGPLSSTPWRGRLGDGQDLTIEWGLGGDLLFTYGERARFRLDPGGGRLGCAPLDPAALDWQRVLLTRVLPNVSLACGREALHASAVDTPLGVVAVAAPSGTGKSTLALELMRRGWPLFADDVLVLSPGSEEVEAHPAGPHMNLAADGVGGARGEEMGSTLASLSGERWIEASRVSREARPVVAIVLLERSPGAPLETRSLESSPISLAPHMLGLPDDGPTREASRFALYSDLVASVSLLRLTADLTDRPADLAESLERTLGLSASLGAAA